ncbi:MAG: hypothetical protein C0404_14285, partial [Verrucomicrobia bacterium]|nr:hypothetical protein [Verrucomicrobiota bacterium]
NPTNRAYLISALQSRYGFGDYSRTQLWIDDAHAGRLNWVFLLHLTSDLAIGAVNEDSCTVVEDLYAGNRLTPAFDAWWESNRTAKAKKAARTNL